MPKDITSISELEVGSVIRNKGSKQTYVVIETGKTVTAVRAVDVSNPNEWELVLKPELVISDVSHIKIYET